MDGANNNHGLMGFLEQCKGILKIQKFRRMVSYTGFYCFATLITYAYTSNTFVLFLLSPLEPSILIEYLLEISN